MEMKRNSKKLALFLALFMAISLLPTNLMAKISVGPNKKEVFMTGQLCKSHDDCKTNSVYSGNFCVNKNSGSELGHCVGFGSTLDEESIKEEKASKKKGTCGKCKTSADCKGCPAAAACETIILDHVCV